YIKTKFLISNINFLNILIFFAPSDSRFSNSCISAKYCPILTNNTSMESLFIQLSDDCRLERKEMKVRDLGLGYDSDEIVVFKYCVGTCMSARKNYDLALKVLTDNGSISGRKVSTHPCCRPTRFETVSFMDAQTSWQTIKWLSAANCSCVG
uniref:Artemin a n=1 Tax=Sinocyclocheilus rhinocerous TaxID=307959 RepID=A0A673J2Q5_9TELE